MISTLQTASRRETPKSVRPPPRLVTDTISSVRRISVCWFDSGAWAIPVTCPQSNQPFESVGLVARSLRAVSPRIADCLDGGQTSGMMSVANGAHPSAVEKQPIRFA